MVAKERIQEYYDWFNNLSFFQGNSFIIDEIENLWILLRFIDTTYYPIVKNIEQEGLSYERVALDECLKLVEEFFKRHKIDINIKELLENDTLEFKGNAPKDNLYKTSKTGSSFYTEEGKRKIVVYLDGTILDCVSIIHELFHYLNQPPIKRNFTSHLLTESISYGAELIFIEELKNTAYDSDRTLYLKRYILMMFKYAYEVYYIYKVILLFKRTGSLTKEAYSQNFKDDEYELTLDRFEEFAKEKRNITKETWYIIGFPLAIYLLEEYRKNPNFFDTILEFNNSINEKSIFDCLKIIGIENKPKLMESLTKSSDSFIEMIANLKEKKYK